MEHLKTMDGETLTSRIFKPLPFIVEGMLSSGLFILAGAPKVGKSWFSLQLCLSLAEGNEFMGFKTQKSTALYLCLEDSFERIQSRLLDITEYAPPNVHFAVMSKSIGEGLEEQIEAFIKTFSETRLIIIDTLQKIRSVSADNAYANDYKELSVLKALADRLGISILLVHHLRKTKDSDPFNMISGTTGISGCADGSFVLYEKKRGEGKAVLYCVGRDIESREMDLIFDKDTHLWHTNETENHENETDHSLRILADFIVEKKSFNGTASELLEQIQPKLKRKFVPSTLSKLILQNIAELEKNEILFSQRRSGGVRLIELVYTE